MKKRYTRIDDHLYSMSDTGQVLCSLCAAKGKAFITIVCTNLDDEALRCDDCKGYIRPAIETQDEGT